MIAMTLIRRRLPSIVLLVLAGSTWLGCGQNTRRQGGSPTPPPAATQAQSTDRAVTQEPAGLRNQHDEPIVIDNGPVKILLSSAAQHGGPTQPNIWTRHFYKFAALYIIPRDGSGDATGEDKAYWLCGTCPVRLFLGPAGNPGVETDWEQIVLAPVESNQGPSLDLLSMDTGKRYYAKAPPPSPTGRSTNRLLPQMRDGEQRPPALRVAKIMFTERNGGDLPHPLVDGDRYKHLNVEILLTGTPTR
jgi:hypothetical protein